MKTRIRVTIYFSGGNKHGYVDEQVAQNISNIIACVDPSPDSHYDVDMYDMAASLSSTHETIRLHRDHISGIVLH
jgi:CBS-domain-containing membrane protein